MSSINRSPAGLKHNHLLVHCKVSKRFLICNAEGEKNYDFAPSIMEINSSSYIIRIS